MTSFINYKSGLEDWLSSQQVDEYLKLIGVEFKKPNLQTLRMVVRKTYEVVPFQNLTMLLRPRVAPTPETITSDMLRGIGGLGTTINPFLCALLQKMGFQSGLLMVSLDKPNCHFGILVHVEGEDMWVDIGNGFPYLEPYSEN